jgi:haloacetate dehalogenase
MDEVAKLSPYDQELFRDFTPHRICVDEGVEISALVGGSGPPLLLLHGHPQTRAMWHKVAPALAKNHMLVMADLRGYGDSSKPAGQPDHMNYSKRVMANDQVKLMMALGFTQFDILAHDRGARVAHRLAVDHSQNVGRMVLLDIAPTLAMYEQTSRNFAAAYWHWFFLIQAAPLPERLIQSDPKAYVREVIGRRSAGLAPFAPAALAAYEHAMSLPGTAHGICEDYRAAASIDLEHDRADREAGNRLATPTLILWGEQGVVNSCFQPMKEWQLVATSVQGEALPCGHYIAEEVPEVLVDRAVPFLTKP